MEIQLFDFLTTSKCQSSCPKLSQVIAEFPILVPPTDFSIPRNKNKSSFTSLYPRIILRYGPIHVILTGGDRVQMVIAYSCAREWAIDLQENVRSVRGVISWDVCKLELFWSGSPERGRVPPCLTRNVSLPS